MFSNLFYPQIVAHEKIELYKDYLYNLPSSLDDKQADEDLLSPRHATPSLLLIDSLIYLQSG